MFSDIHYPKITWQEDKGLEPANLIQSIQWYNSSSVMQNIRYGGLSLD